jgi:hypothetical protein
MRADLERKVQEVATAAWEGEVRWPDILAWCENFDGAALGSAQDERDHALLALTKFIYFSRRLVRELLRSAYRDLFEAPVLQRIRRNHQDTKDIPLLRRLYDIELGSTRFVGVGNPAESGAHLLYYFRQVNYLKKDLFADLSALFTPSRDPRTGELAYTLRDANISRIVFFDDLVGSGTQARMYLSTELSRIRRTNPSLEITFLSLFATTAGIARLNEPALFDGKATCMFELDDSYKAFASESRYFVATPAWFSSAHLEQLARQYGAQLRPQLPLGYKDGQLMLGFSHNTPDNTMPIFWDEGGQRRWSPVFPRYDKKYT